VRGALLGSADPAAAWKRFSASAHCLPALDRAIAAQGAHA
jgi:hypothetical protein